MNMAENRSFPNILITGTPGTGKTTLAQEIVSRTDKLHLFSVGEVVTQHSFYESYDEARQCHVVDEEKLLDHLEDEIGAHSGGCILEYHGSDLFPERWFDVVFVLRTSNTQLFDRLTSRGYIQSKITENLDCEIFGTLLEEAKESYKPEIVHELQSDTPDDMENNINNILTWIEQWKNDNDNNKSA